MTRHDRLADSPANKEDVSMLFRLLIPTLFLLTLSANVFADNKQTTEEPAPPLFEFDQAGAQLAEPGKVRVEILEGLSKERSWQFDDKPVVHLFDTDYFAMKELPRKYTPRGLITNRVAPLLLHLTSQVELPEGEYEFLLRSVDAARLYVNGEMLTEVPLNPRGSGAHSPYYDGLDRGPDILSLAEGHVEKTATIKVQGGPQVISVYRLIVTKGISQRLGELILAYRPVGAEQYQILGPEKCLSFTDEGWLDFLDWEQNHLTQVNTEHRRAAVATDAPYWERRHKAAREHYAAEVAVPDVTSEEEVANDLDRFILSRLEEEGIQPTPLIEDLQFLRRLSLDTIGLIPSDQHVELFLSLPEASRRSQIIDILLEDPQYADHWVPYWQDVLAENPGLTKPELNNTGPFRWYLHEAFSDNKPFDRIVTELVMMNGDRLTGGPAGFGMASQNDVPMAAKAHIIGTAFLGVDMKCARCHDAPYHDIKQSDLFSLAAMLKRGPQKVPETSSIPGTPEELEQMTVRVTLSPGSDVAPNWPFSDLLELQEADEDLKIPSWVVRNQKDSREQLAAILTSPNNQRFANVIVNRLWKRYLGYGLVEPVDDWENNICSHPELLNYLSRELVVNHYDLKHVIRLILNSNTYQREVSLEAQADSDLASLFPGPMRRRMSAEQLIDSLYAATGKTFESEELTMDLDARLAQGSFGRFGIPRKSWEMVSVSNERDRPSLNLPVAQTVTDLLIAFGWRQQRQEPLTDREATLTPLQPMALANGVASNRALDISDRSDICDLCLKDQSLSGFVDDLFTKFLTRLPTDEERESIEELLSEGFEQRIIAGPEAVPAPRIYRSGVCWTSHFDPKADEEIMRRQREILNGSPPSHRLNADWRERVEDVMWSLVNSPEFVFIP